MADTIPWGTPQGRPPLYPADHPLASPYMKRMYADPPIPFTGATFTAYLQVGTLKFQDGTLRISFVVPESHMADALPLRLLTRRTSLVKLQVSLTEE